MPVGRKGEDNCRLRVDPVLVDKFRLLQGGINEVGTKVVRDLGLRYSYDKHRGTLDLLGPDTEILSLAIETLRFWIEDDEFPDTGITCQVGYPNRRIIVWRFHGDYAKKFDHLFAVDIAKLKLITSVNIKAVPNKRNPEYVELYCHFSVYHQVKGDVARVANELSKIFQDDFFIPKSDLWKAREFARSKIHDEKVLYALKEYPDTKIRVWLFARDHMDIIRARKEWVAHVGIIARANEFTETVNKADSIRSASFYGHPASALGSETSEPVPKLGEMHDAHEERRGQDKNKKQLSHTLSQIMSKRKTRPRINKKVSPRNGGPEYDNSNFPRPTNFVYPVNHLSETDEDNPVPDDNNVHHNPLDANAFDGGGENVVQHNALGSFARWVRDDDSYTNTPRSTLLYPNNRIYVHQQVSTGDVIQPNFNQVDQTIGTTVVHPDTNLVPKERYNSKHQPVLTKENDPSKKRTVRKGVQKMTQGSNSNKRLIKSNLPIRQKRPTLQTNKTAPMIRYNINVNGLDIFMYKQDITKVTNMDAIANIVASNLKSGGLVATNVFTEAGKQVTDELNVHISLYGEGKTSDSVVTSAGRLPALGIMHIVSPIWKDYTVWEECASDLHIALYNVLKTAETHKYRKIAIPTIGSEPYFGVPKDLVAEIYVKALVDYSVGMGPMYPVLEIHLVDLDVNMLKYIKDAYESWASTPGMEDMTQNLNKGSESTMRNLQDMSTRSESAVSLKTLPSHRSENMVTFNGQSYTQEGEQVWTFDVLRKLSVHVYTGSILKLRDIEAIVCAVDVNMKGNLAKQVSVLGGKQYRASLKRARGNRTLVEGEVLICDAGDLSMRYVLHSIIAQPIHVASQKNISRLDSINTQVFYAANQHRIKSLAMPLIGTGRLRERFEVETCSLQLIDNIIEMCLGIGTNLKLKDLHLVNTNHIMTQYLTQALRTRAHTKLRVETEPEATRQDVLSKDKATTKTSTGQQRQGSAKSSKSKSVNGETVYTVRDVTQAVNKENGVLQSGVGGPDKLTDNKVDSKATNQDETSTHGRVDVNDKIKRNVPYLSMQTLQQHNRSVQDAWKQQTGGDDNVDKQPPNTARNNKNGEVVKKAQDYLQESKLAKTKRAVKKPNRRIIQRSSDYILQKSPAESYKTLFYKKRRYSEMSQRDEMVKLRKSQSSDDIWKNGNAADNVLESLQEEKRNVLERIMVLEDRERHMNHDTGYDYTNTIPLNSAREIDTRFRPHDQHNANHKPTDYDGKSRTDVHKARGNGYRTERLVHSKSEGHVHPIPTRRKSERYLIDNEREDLYMMDMDYLVREQERRKLDSNLLEDGNIPIDTHYQNHETDNTLPTARLTHRSDRSEEKLEKPSALPSMSKPLEGSLKVNDQQQFGEDNTRGLGPDMIGAGEHVLRDVTDRIQSPIEMTNSVLKTEDNIEPIQNYPRQVEERNTISNKELVSNPNNVNKHTNNIRSNIIRRNKTEAGNKAAKNATSYSNKGKPTVTFSDMHQIKRSNTQGRAEYVQAYTKTPRRSPEPNQQRKIIEWKNETKMTEAALDRYNSRRNRTAIPPKPDEVTIRDQLKLQIEIVDNKSESKTETSEDVEKEKKKIKRFWEVVGKDSISEADMYGEEGANEETEKMLVAKVTKERVMSAKTTASRQSKQSVTTHNVGDFNVTLAVAD